MNAEAATVMVDSCEPAQEVLEEVPVLQARIRELQSQLLFAWACFAQLHYTHQDLLRRIYGKRSEKLKTVLKDMGQQSPQTPVATAAQTPEGTEVTTDKRSEKPPRKHGGGGRRAPPAHLPVVRDRIDLPEEEKAGLIWIRDEITHQLGYRPSQFYIQQTIRPVYASPAREQPPTVAPLPAQVIPQAGVHVSFIVHVILSRFCWHIPYYRQEMIDAQSGVFIPRQARYRYAMAAANLLMTIREGLKQKVLESGYVQIDETFTDLIDPDRQGRTRKCYLWGYLSPHEQAAVIEFSINRSGVNLEEFFKDCDFQGAIHSDAARMYDRFIKKHPHVRHYLCLGHLRRYLIKALQANEAEALPLLEEIGKLYAIEEQATEQGLTDRQRGYLRHGLAKPILKGLQRRFRQLKASGTLYGNLRKAIHYGLRRWRDFASYAKVDRGYVRIDNNNLEALWRPLKVGFRNAMFIGHPAAGWVCAVLYSIMATCSLLKINPREYLLWVLPKLAARDTTEAHKGLLPQDFARLQAGKFEPVPGAAPAPQEISVMPLPENLGDLLPWSLDDLDDPQEPVEELCHGPIGPNHGDARPYLDA